MFHNVHGLVMNFGPLPLCTLPQELVEDGSFERKTVNPDAVVHANTEKPSKFLLVVRLRPLYDLLNLRCLRVPSILITDITDDMNAFHAKLKLVSGDGCPCSLDVQQHRVKIDQMFENISANARERFLLIIIGPWAF